MEFDSWLGKIELTPERLYHVLTFHPDVARHRTRFAATLLHPEVIRRSTFDERVFIFYKRINHYFLAIVVKTNARNFILTAYLTSKIQHQPL